MNNEMTLWEQPMIQVSTPVQTVFSWDETFAETKELVREDAELTATIDDAMVKRFHGRVKIGFNLMALQKEHAKDGHGDFTTVELPKLGITDRTFAYRCINVAKLFQNLGGNPSVASLQQTEIFDLPMPLDTWNRLASPSGQTVVQQLESGGIKPTQAAITQALEEEKARLAEEKRRNKELEQELEAERKVHSLFKEDTAFNERVREQAHVALVQSLEQQLEEKPEPEKVIEYRDTLETASKIDELETLIDFLEAKPNIPPETQTELDKLQLDLKNAKTELGFYEGQNKALADKNKQLSEESRRSFVENITAVGQLRIRQEWQAATSVLQASHSAFHLKIPSQIDRESFEGEEHTRTAQTIQVLEETIAKLKKTLPHSGNALEQADIIEAELFPMPVIHEAKRPVIGIPPEYDELFAEYKQAVRSYPEPELLWNAQDQGYPHHMIEPEKHIQFTKELLSSEVDRRVKAAVEAMKRTLGIWEDAIHAHRQETLSS